MRRFAPRHAVLALLALAAPLHAAPAAAQALAGVGPEVTSVVSGADRDRDGRVSRAEIRDALSRAAASAPGEFERAWAAQRAAASGEPAIGGAAARAALALLLQADANGDGAVSAEEAQAFAASRPPQDRQAVLYALALADLDFDGQATRAEIEGLRRRVEALGDAPPPAAEGAEVAEARREARRDFLDGKARERATIEEVWDRMSSADGYVPLADLMRELFGSPD